MPDDEPVSLEELVRQARRTQWQRAMAEAETVPTALSLFTLHVVGSLLLMASAIAGLYGLVRLTGALGTSVAARAIGLGVLVGAALGFAGGRLMIEGYAVRRRR